MKRRVFIKRTLSAGAITALYAWQIEPFWLEFVRIKMPIKNLPKELIGKTFRPEITVFELEEMA